MINTENNSIDKTILTIAVALTIGVFTITSNDIQYTKYTSVVTIMLLMAAILTTMWHQFRSSLRNKIFEDKKEKTLKDAEEDIERILEEAKENGKYKAKAFVLEKMLKEKKLSHEELKEITLKTIEDDSDQNEHIAAKLIAENITMKLKNNFQESFLEPIDEKNSQTKFLLDLFANKWRYHLFTFGCILFVIHSTLSALN